MGAVLLAEAQGTASEGVFAARVEALRDAHVSLWEQLPAELPELGPPTSFLGHIGNARDASRLVDAIAAQLERFPEAELERRAWRESVRTRLLEFGIARLGWPKSYASLPFGEAYVDAALDFAREARAFDPKLRLEDLWQALRNVGIGNTLQMLLGRAISLRPGLFAYSMLYPLTDNFLDDARVGGDAKRDFGLRFGRRLCGQPVRPLTRRDEDVFSLVARIEDEFPRGAFPDVHESLRAIHRAQLESLRTQQDPGLADAEILAISCEKGGSSVLADLYLVAGRPTAAEERFAFGYGVCLQLLDDLQDVTSDLAAGHETLFTRAARRGPIDAVAARLARLVHRVLDEAAVLASTTRHDDPMDFVRRACRQLLVDSIADQEHRFTRRFRHRIAGQWPFSLAGTRRLRRRASWRFAEAARRLQQRTGARSLVDLVAAKPELTEEARTARRASSQRLGRRAWYGPRSATGS